MAIYPLAKPVKGKGGDEGLDTFLGDFDGCIKAFQHKYFLDKIGASQRRQIEKSLKKAIEKHKIDEWLLMLPCDLNPAEIRWFTALTKKYDTVKMDWWGKTKIQDLLSQNPSIAVDFQPRPNISLFILQGGIPLQEASVTQLADILRRGSGLSPGVNSIEAVEHVLIAAAKDLKNRTIVKVLIWGPGASSGDIYQKRVELKDRLERLGHVVHFSEEVCTPDLLTRTGLNLSVAELLQASTYDYIICLMASPGSIGEVHDFAGLKEFAAKMMICIDGAHRGGYSAHGVLRRFEGHNGKIDWFTYPKDIIDCHLAGRVLDQIQKVAESKHWELAVGALGL